MAVGRTRGQDAGNRVGVQDNDVESQIRQETRREAEDQVGGLLQPTSWSSMGEGSEEQSGMETGSWATLVIL
ncbi:hypothetical protein C0J52_08827 [Blattella germanica]|nr:hypothetical protein C0J52_08827 [Blattella germanica]